jgi:hypothetical protein
MPGERIGNSNQYLTISGVVSAPAYSWASDNDTGLYRIGANNIGIAASGAKVLDIATTGLTVTGAFAASNGVSSTLTTDATSATTGSIITAGGISTQKALWVGTTSRHVGATQFDAAITYGGITLSNAVTGTGNMVLSASPTLTGTLTAATITASGAVTGASFIPSSATIPTNGLYLSAANTPSISVNGALAATFSDSVNRVEITAKANTSINLRLTGTDATKDYAIRPYDGTNGWIFGLDNTTVGAGGFGILTHNGNVRFSMTQAGAATFVSNVTATYFTPTATGTNGIGLAAANTPAFYASTTEVMRSTTALTTLNLPTTLRYDSASGLDFKFQNQTDGTASYTGMRWGVGGLGTNAGGVAGYAASWTTANNQRAAGMEFFSTGAGGTVISALGASGDVFIYNRGTLACTFGASQVATFAANISATYFTPTATGTNGIGLAAANTPAFYASTTEVLRATTSLVTVATSFKAADFNSVDASSGSCTGGVPVVISLIGIGTNGIIVIGNNQDEGGMVAFSRNWGSGGPSITTLGSKNCTFGTSGGDVTATFTTTGTFSGKVTKFKA